MEESYALGLDLGTTFSCIGVYRNGEVEIIPNRHGDKITPSIVTILDENTVLAGEDTLNYLVKNYDSTIYAIKRFIGRDYQDTKVQQDLKEAKFPFKIVGGKNPSVEVTKNGKKIQFTLEEISSFVIKKLVDNAEKLLHSKVTKLVITVPANFKIAQKTCTEQAANLADIEVLRIINEPTAAALAYGLQNKQKDTNGKILVFDLGGGTFDVSILSITKTNEENFEVISTKGDIFLGGEDFDNKLVDYFLDKFCKKYEIKKEDILKDKKKIKNLKISCESVKRTLSSSKSTTLSINNFYNNKELIETIEREEFENLCEDLFKRLEGPLAEAIQEASQKTKHPIKISEIVLVGGSTRIPKIKTFLLEYFGKDININDSINPDEAVAYGATLMAAKIILKKDKVLSDFNLLDITPLSLGVAVENNNTNKKILDEGLLMSVIVKRATNIPYNNYDIFSTASDNQTSAQITIYEGEKKFVKYNHKLGELLLKNLPPKPKGQVKIKVKFFINVNGILTVTASELSEKGEELRPVEIEIEYQSIGLDNEKIKKLKEKNKKYFDKIKSVSIKEHNNIREELKESEEALKEATDEDEKYEILMGYNSIYSEFIDSLDTNFDNETMFEKYYIYLKELFESYTKILNIDKKEDSINEYKEEVKENIKKYIIIFTQKISGYLYDLLDILQTTPKKIFYEIVVFTIEQINIKGKKCLEEKKEFCRYNCLMHFERAYSIFKKYIENITKLAICPKISKNCKEQIRICLLYINEVKTGSILLLEDSIKEGKLIKSNNTGFTNSTIGLKFSKEEEKEKYEIILQNYEKMLREINQNTNNEGNKMPIKNNDDITEAICIANIIKISNSFLGNNNYKRFIKLGERCQYLAEQLGKTEDDWYKEFTELYNEIKSYEKEINEEKLKKKITTKHKDKFDEVEKEFNKKNTRKFIEFVLGKYPYKDYEDDKKEKKIDFSNELALLHYLITKYHPNEYSYTDEDEQSQLFYFMVEFIESYLNNLYQNIQL